MNFSTKIFTHIQASLKKLMCDLNCTYYIDTLSAIINPELINVVSYSTNIDTTKKYFKDHGFTEILCKNINNDISMTYKDIITIKITECLKTYKENKTENDKITSVGLSHIVKRMVEKGHTTFDIRSALLNLATYT